MLPVVHAIGLDAAGLDPAAAVEGAAGVSLHAPPSVAVTGDAGTVVAGETTEAPTFAASTALRAGGGGSLFEADVRPLPPSNTVAKDGAVPALLLPHAGVVASRVDDAFGALVDADLRSGDTAGGLPSPALEPWAPRTISAKDDDRVRACWGSLVDRLVAGLCPFSLAPLPPPPPLLLLLPPPRLVQGPASSPPLFSQLASTSLSSRLRAPALGQAPEPELRLAPPAPPAPPPSRLSRRELPDLDQEPPASSSRRSRAEPSLPHAPRPSSPLPLSWREAPLAHGAPPPPPPPPVSSRSFRPSPAPGPLLPLEGASLSPLSLSR